MKHGLRIFSIFSFAISAAINTASADDHQAKCPTSFADVSVHDAAKLCQIFDASDKSPSQSLSYFVAESPEQLIAYYQSAHPQLEVRSQFNQRTLLTMRDDMTRVAISQDPNGSQIDILIL